MPVTTRLNSGIRIKKEISGMIDLVEITSALCKLSIVAHYLSPVDSHETRQQLKVGLPPQVPVTCHRIHGKILQQALNLQKLEERTFPMVESVTQISEVQSWPPLSVVGPTASRSAANRASTMVMKLSHTTGMACRLQYS